MTYESQLQKLRQHYRRYGNLPTYDNMRSIFNCKSRSTVYYTVNKLIRAGFLKRSKHQLLPGPRFEEMSFFNSVKAGFPSPAEEEANDRMSLDRYLIDHPGSTVFIRVQGNSLESIGILGGDLAVVQRGLQARLGQLVAVSTPEDYMIKPLDSDAMQEVIGVVKAVVRKL